MRKTVIFCAVLFCAAVLTACTGDNGDTDATDDDRTTSEAVLPSEPEETEELETALPFDPDLPVQYSPDGKSALVTEDSETDQVKRLYQDNEPKGCMEETRWWR
ncbi:MAG: hypothetical protein K2N46_06160, partial [Lachnospiraceae bacterium]|nr:hypothetical protein [Lachnospiraceae bacterium]